MRAYLVRHGQTAWNAERKNQGHTDIPLDADGLEQARLLVSAFEERPFSRILTSDLERSYQTAEPLAARHGIAIEKLPGLRERCFGDWEAMAMERVAQNFLDQELLIAAPREAVRPPNGESLVDVWVRQEPVAKEIEESSIPTVVICHGGSGGVLLARLLQGTVATARAFRFDNTGITTLARRPDGGFQLIGYNDSSHLRAPALTGSVDGVAR